VKGSSYTGDMSVDTVTFSVAAKAGGVCPEGKFGTSGSCADGRAAAHPQR